MEYYLFQNQAGTVQIFCGLFRLELNANPNLQPQNRDIKVMKLLKTIVIPLSVYSCKKKICHFG
jgi:hypothetical protein